GQPGLGIGGHQLAIGRRAPLETLSARRFALDCVYPHAPIHVSSSEGWMLLTTTGSASGRSWHYCAHGRKFPNAPSATSKAWRNSNASCARTCKRALSAFTPS